MANTEISKLHRRIHMEPNSPLGIWGSNLSFKQLQLAFCSSFLLDGVQRCSPCSDVYVKVLLHIFGLKNLFFKQTDLHTCALSIRLLRLIHGEKRLKNLPKLEMSSASMQSLSKRLAAEREKTRVKIYGNLRNTHIYENCSSRTSQSLAVNWSKASLSWLDK